MTQDEVARLERDLRKSIYDALISTDSIPHTDEMPQWVRDAVKRSYDELKARQPNRVRTQASPP